MGWGPLKETAQNMNMFTKGKQAYSLCASRAGIKICVGMRQHV